MKEESHKHEMAAALRADFERLRARRGETVLAQVSIPVVETAEARDPTAPTLPARRRSVMARLFDR